MLYTGIMEEMNKLANTSCADFAAVLASSAPVPGGGGAAALAGALGAALISMVGNLTLGKKKYAAVEEDVRVMLDKAASIRTQLLELIDKDAAAFKPLQKAYAIPKDDPARVETLQRVSLDACRAPLAMMRQCCAAIDLLHEMLEKGSAMMVSDTGCGAALCRAALIAASMNIYVNTKSLDAPEAREIEREADEMLTGYCARAEAISDEVLRRIRRKA